MKWLAFYFRLSPSAMDRRLVPWLKANLGNLGDLGDLGLPLSLSPWVMASSAMNLQFHLVLFLLPSSLSLCTRRGEFLPPFGFTVVSFVPSFHASVRSLFHRQYLRWLLLRSSYCHRTAPQLQVPSAISPLLTQRHDPSCYLHLESLNHHLLSPPTPACQQTSNPVTSNTSPQAPASPIHLNPPSKGHHTRQERWW
jgi:hypothetical protein